MGARLLARVRVASDEGEEEEGEDSPETGS